MVENGDGVFYTNDGGRTWNEAGKVVGGTHIILILLTTTLDGLPPIKNVLQQKTVATPGQS